MSYGLEISNSNNVIVITNDNTILNKETVDVNQELAGTIPANSSVSYAFTGAGDPSRIGVNFTEGQAPSSGNQNNGLEIIRNLTDDTLTVKNTTGVGKPYDLQFFRFG
tara:strand:- start:746 stop:1069 length:324 start_codon:yes stop_codon:yes gene_type:complete